MESRNRNNSARRWLLGLCLAWSGVAALGQSVEVGYVQEYNGEQAKTPLGGVELSVVGAPSTVSDNSGKYELRFAVLKPGEPVECNEVYKSGYVVFNEDALRYWRISRSRKPFVIVMCREDAFRQLKKRFYGIIEKSYKDEYLRQKALAEQTVADAVALETKLKQLQKEYEEKLGNINTYVELFARIDRSEMDSVEARTLQLVEAGKIEEGIRTYEELKLLEQTDEQLGKWASGENMKRAAEEMIADSQRDLMTLAEKMQKQIGLYEMGGSKYNAKRDSLMARIIDVYGKLNEAFPGRFNEELGLYLCQYAVYAKPWSKWGENFRRAATLPSSTGLSSLGNYFEMLAYDRPACLDSARACYREALQMQLADSLRADIEYRLALCADFLSVLPGGDTLYYKKVGAKDTVYVWPKTNYCCNRVRSEVLEVPGTVLHNGQKYRVAGIRSRAFFKNRRLRKVVLPESVVFVGEKAFAKCDSLQLVVAGSRLQHTGKEAFPATAVIELPKKVQHTGWIAPLLGERLDWLRQSKQEPSSRECEPTLRLAQRFYALETSRGGHYADSDTRGELHYWMGGVAALARDTATAIRYYCQACRDFSATKGLEYKTSLAVLGYMHYRQANFAEAYRCLCAAADSQLPAAYNVLAYMYARGEHVAQSYPKALELIDRAISLAPQDANYLDSKGEIYLMMGKRDSAQVYWDRIVRLDPQFSTSDSQLYQGLNPHAKEREGLLRRYVELVQTVSRGLYDMQREAFSEIEYEEYLSIGIIAVQALIRDKTGQQLVGYTPEYISTVVKWAIVNELTIRYPWFPQLCYRGVNTASGLEADVKRGLFQKVYRVVQQLKSQSGDPSEFGKQSLQLWTKVEKRIGELPPAQQQLAYALITTQDGLDDVARQHGVGPDECAKLIDFLLSGKKSNE